MKSIQSIIKFTFTPKTKLLCGKLMVTWKRHRLPSKPLLLIMNGTFAVFVHIDDLEDLDYYKSCTPVWVKITDESIWLICHALCSQSLHLLMFKFLNFKLKSGFLNSKSNLWMQAYHMTWALWQVITTCC